MTVCVAVLCDDGAAVIAASDRMLTSGDVEFEPNQSKHAHLTSSVVGLVAGDVSFQLGLMMAVRAEVQGRVEREPGNWWRVGDIAEIYAREFVSARRHMAETLLLRPLGLDLQTFVSRQTEMRPTFVTQLSTELLQFQAPDAECLFIGTDADGAHIYRSSQGMVVCEDAIGFAAIGGGSWHAESHLMFQQHTRNTTMPEAMIEAYFAKRRAETAPGVGEGTDMLLIGPGLGTCTTIGGDAMHQLQRSYARERRAARSADRRAREEVTQYVQTLVTRAQADQAAVPEAGNGDAPADTQPGADANSEEGR